MGRSGGAMLPAGEIWQAGLYSGHARTDDGEENDAPLEEDKQEVIKNEDTLAENETDNVAMFLFCVPPCFFRGFF